MLRRRRRAKPFHPYRNPEDYSPLSNRSCRYKLYDETWERRNVPNSNLKYVFPIGVKTFEADDRIVRFLGIFIGREH